MKSKYFILLIGILLIFTTATSAEELPVPSYDNAVIISIEHSIFDSAEVDYIKSHFDPGLYAWLSFSKTTLSPELAWHSDWIDASTGIQAFKDDVDAHIAAAKQKNVRFHLVLTGGLARSISVYREAKEEDIRNCQWYNDSKLASNDQIGDSDVMNKYVFGTLSRYARKVRANLEAKAKASLAFLKERMDAEPETLVALSGWGEVELSYYRLIPTQSVQDYFCDYSPFAVLEFRDWIQHAGMYDDAAGQYKGGGYAQGGTKYQGASGLTQFNTDFDTNFTTWDLRYYHWDLTDDYDPNPEDSVNNDPHRIPFADYSHGNMMPASGPDYRAGGFDPPRDMRPGNKFWDLWNLFRETMVHHFVKDMAKWASEAGIPASRWYSHQIPADYLYGTEPSTKDKNARYYTSASPLWTARIQPYGSMGATIYDNKFPDWMARTTRYAVPAISSMSANWAAMEFDPETYPVGLDVNESSVSVILEQYFNLYYHHVHFINFWRWIDVTIEHTIKGMRKQEAVRRFILYIRDKARNKNLDIVFDPPKVVELSGSYNTGTVTINLEISGRIWAGHDWKWKDWGDFSHFEIYRGDEPGFATDAAHLLATTSEYTHSDRSIQAGKEYYYRIKAVNTNDVGGPLSDELKMPALTLMLVAGNGGTTDPEPGIYFYDPMVNVTVAAIPDENYEFEGWSGDASGTANPIVVLMDADKSITASFLEFILEPPLNFRGEKIINRSLTQEECINVLNWDANPHNQDVAHYRIYQGEASIQNLLVELGSDVFEYYRRRVVKDKEYTYAITAVDIANKESRPATVTIQ